MRLSRALIVTILGASIALPPALAAAGAQASGHFIVSARATLTERWSYSSSSTAGGCKSAVTGHGTRTISFRSSDVSPVSFSWSGGNARARFGGGIEIGGSVLQSGTKTVRVTGGSACDVGTHRLVCSRHRSSFTGREIRVVSRRVHRMSLMPLRGVVPSSFYTDCPGEPRAIQRLSNGLEIADAGYSERDLADGTTGGFDVDGAADVTTSFFTPPGKVTQRIRWTLLFRRVG